MGQEQRSRPGSLVPAAAVFALFVIAGSASLYNELSDRPAPRRAVPGSPTPAGAAPAQAAEGQLPAGHPTLELPEQVVRLLGELQKAADAAPEDLEAWLRLARGYYRAGLLDARYHERATKALDHVLELDADNLEGLRMYGNVAHDARQFEKAEKLFLRYLELDPSDPGVKTDLASTWLFQDRTADAERAYREVIASSPGFVQAHVNLGIALHAQGKTDEAVAAFQHARSIAGSDEQRARIDDILAAAGAAPLAAPDARPAASPRTASPRPPQPGPGSRPAPPAAPAVPSSRSNAASVFQRGADSLLTGHRIVGPRVVAIEWSSDTQARATLRSFPMDKMPPVMRNKFKSGMNEKLAELAVAQAVAAPVRIELVDEASGNVMDVLDAKEWVGAFDEDAYE